MLPNKRLLSKPLVSNLLDTSLDNQCSLVKNLID